MKYVAILLVALVAGLFAVPSEAVTNCGSRSSTTESACMSVDRLQTEVGDFLYVEAWLERNTSSCTWCMVSASIDIDDWVPFGTITRVASGGSTSTTKFSALIQLKTVNPHTLTLKVNSISRSPTFTIDVRQRFIPFAFSTSSSTAVIGGTVVLTAGMDGYQATGNLVFTMQPPGGSWTDIGTVTLTPYPVVQHYEYQGTYYFIAPVDVPGDYHFGARYTGDEFNSGVTHGGVLVRVGPFGTSVQLSQSISTSMTGQPVTLQASVTGTNPGNTVPTGTVSFLDGATVLGTVQLNSSGAASLVTKELRRVGAHSITARYNGDANNQPSTSAVVTHTSKFNPAILVPIFEILN